MFHPSSRSPVADPDPDPDLCHGHKWLDDQQKQTQNQDFKKSGFRIWLILVVISI